jgi:transposase-like protein
MEPFTLTQAAKLLVNESFAWEKFEEMRWPSGAECPHCRSRDVRYLPPRSGTRPTSTGKVSYRRVWRCSECKKQFSALVGTIFEGSKIPIGKWMLAVYLMCSGKNGVSAHELHRDLGITYKSAWFMTQRIRKAMDLSPAAELFTGNVIADETWVGGEPKFRHANKRVGSKQGKSDKTPVVSLVNTETGEVRSAVVDAVSTKTISRIVEENVEIGTTTLHSDSWRGYIEIGGKMAGHHVVDHHVGQYVTEKSFGTNAAEGYFSQLSAVTEFPI